MNITALQSGAKLLTATLYLVQVCSFPILLKKNKLVHGEALLWKQLNYLDLNV